MCRRLIQRILLGFDYFHISLNKCLWHQGREVSHNFFDLRAASGKTGYCGWASEDQWRELFCKPLDRSFVLPANSDAELDFGDVGRGFAREMTVCCVHADELRQDHIKFQAKTIEAFAED